MKPSRYDAIERMVAVLNGDILREIRMADTCIRQANHLKSEFHPVIQQQIVLCAATALANATALAAEVLALGGVPVDPGTIRRATPDHLKPLRRHTAQAQTLARTMLTHYRSRLRMAERLGLMRLREVFQQIVHTKEWHLAHSGLIRAGDSADRYLYS